MNKKRFFLTIIVSGISFVAGYLINYFLTEYITVNVGTEAFGFVSLSKTIASYAMIGSAALNSYAARFIAVEYHKRNYHKANIYYNSVFWGNVFLSIIISIIWFVVVASANIWMKDSQSLIVEVKWLFLLTLVNIYLQLTGTAFQAVAIIKDKLLMSSFFKMISYIVEGGCLVALFFFSSIHLYYVAIGSIMATLCIVVANYWMTKHYAPQLRLKFDMFDIAAMKELLVSGMWNSVNTLGNTLNSGLDLVISKWLLGAFAMGQVSIVKVFSNIFSAMYSMISQPFQPHLLKLYVDGKKDELVRSLKLSMKVSGAVANISFSGIVAFGLCYFKLWMPNQDVSLLYRLSIICVASSILEGAVYPLYYIYTLTVKNKLPSIITIIGGVINVLAMIVMIKGTKLGIYIVFLTTMIVMLIVNGVTNPIYMAKCLNVKWYTFYPEIFRHLLATGAVTLIVFLINSIIKPVNWASLIICALLTVIIGTIVHGLIVFGPKEIIKLVGRRMNVK